MSTKNLAYINGKLLQWARERRGWSQEQLAEKLSNTNGGHVKDWEEGKSYPAYGKAVKIATALHVPFGYLFVKVPPNDIPPIPDLRTRKGETPKELSTNFIDLLYSVKSKHEWFRNYLIDRGSEELPFVSRFDSFDDKNEIATNIRVTIGFKEARRNSRSWEEFLTRLVKNTENVGIVVLRSGVVGNNNTRPLSVDEFQGFAIADRFAPLVFINAKDFVTAKIFTLAHELAHIWTGISGISSLDHDPRQLELLPQNEVFCNRIAVEVLVPEKEFREKWVGQFNLQTIERLGRIFRVSNRVIVRRARELGLIDSENFALLWEQTKSKEKPRKKTDGGNFAYTEDARHSPIFMGAVYDDVRAGETTYREGARLLDVKVPTFEKLMEGSQP